MGYNSTTRFIYMLEGGDTVISGNTGEPVELGQFGPWRDGFADTICARFASEGLAQIIRNTQLDPEVNHVDFLRPVYPEIKTPDHFKESSISESGSRSLQINAEAGPTDIDLRGPVFRVSEGQPYRFSIRYQTDTLTNNQFEAGVSTYDADFNAIGSQYFGPSITRPGTNNVWQWLSFVHTPDVNARFMVVRVLDQPAKNGYILFDKILVTPVANSWKKTKTAAQTNVIAGGSQVTFNAAEFAYGVTDGTDQVTIVKPGKYRIGVYLPLTCGTATESMDVRLVINASTPYYIAGSEMGRIGAVHHANGTRVLDLARGDTVAVVAASSAATADIPANTYNGEFTGELIV